MDVREKLVELLKQTEINKINGHTALAETCFTPNVFENMANNLIANGATVQEWISVKDGLPENDYGKHWKERKYYLVRYEPSGLMCVAHYGYKEYGWWIDGHDCVLSATNFRKSLIGWKLTICPNRRKENDYEVQRMSRLHKMRKRVQPRNQKEELPKGENRKGEDQRRPHPGDER